MIGIDSTLQYDKQYVMTLRSIAPVNNSSGVARQNLDPKPYIGKRIRMSGYMKTKDLSYKAVFWLRVDRDGKTLIIDYMNNRPIEGTTEWKNYSIVLDVPQNATDLAYGALLQGTGQVWFTNPVFDIVENSVSATTIGNQLMTFPIIKSVSWIGVLPVQGVDEIPDPGLNYRLLMELATGIKNNQDSTSIRGVNNGLASIGRILNLHAASAIPPKNIEIVAVVHGAAINALLENVSYKKKYGIDNPNMTLVKELQDASVKFIACGQTMMRLDIRKEDLIPGVKTSLTAQTVLSS